MNTKTYALLIIAVLASLIYASFATAALAPYPYPDMDMFVTNANQYYSVIYDGEGEALVSLRIDIRNNEPTPMDGILVEIPSPYVQLYAVAENIPSGYIQECIRYVDGCEEFGAGSTCVTYDVNGNCLEYERPCLNVGQVCDEYRNVGAATTGYTRLEVTPTPLADSVSLPVEFSAPLMQGNTRTLLLMYKINDAADKSAGVFRYDFATARLPLMTRNVRVATNVQSGLILKGLKSNIDYRTDFAVLESSFSKMGAGAVQDEVYMSYANSISRARGVVDSATYLDAHESMVSSGQYSSSWFALYWGRLLWIILVILAVIGVIIFSSKRLKTYTRKEKKVTKKETESKGFTLPFLSGLYTALSMLGLWIVTLVIVGLGHEFLRRSDFWDILGPLFIVLAVIGTLALLIGIPIHMSKKHGSTIGVYTLLSTLGWMFIFFIIAFIVAAVLVPSPVYLIG